MFIDLKVKVASWIWTSNSFCIRGFKPRQDMVSSSAPASACLSQELGIWIWRGKKQAKEFLANASQVRILLLWTHLFPIPPNTELCSPAHQSAAVIREPPAASGF